jgi:ABC-2 type transport system permease protein
MVFTAVLKKEFRLILRDRIHLLVLFLMPAIFIVTLSLALKDAYRDKREPGIRLAVLNRDRGDFGGRVLDELAKTPSAAIDVLPAAGSIDGVKESLLRGAYRMALVLPEDLSASFAPRFAEPLSAGTQTGDSVKGPSIRFLFDPAVDAGIRTATLQAVRFAVLGTALETARAESAPFGGEAPLDFARNVPVDLEGVGESWSGRQLPTAVQQNVPAWALFAMFFIVLPLSAGYTAERNQQTLVRLETMPVPRWVLLAGKMLPYMAVNLLQLILMLWIGIAVIPLLGGDRLVIGDSLAGLALAGAAASLAAVSFGLLVAVHSKNAGRAAAFGPPAIVILAAMGGILVPKLIMPPFMQRIAAFSPFDWMLGAFLDLFLKDATPADIAPRLARLAAFSCLCLAGALFGMRRRT